MTPTSLEDIKARYIELVGEVPEGIQKRFDVGEVTNRINAFIAIKELRNELIHKNTLGARVQQLALFGQLLTILKLEPAELHARAAKKAGTSLEKLVGAVETALNTAGIPSNVGGITILHQLNMASEA